jgi:hypothetical protein
MNRASLWIALLTAVTLLTVQGCGREEAAQETVREVVRYTSPPRASVTGSVAVPGTTELAGILVFAEGTSHLAVTDRFGTFELSDLPEGLYLLRAFRADLRPQELGELLITAADLEAPQPFLALGTFELEVDGRVMATREGGSASAGLGSLTGRVVGYSPTDGASVVVELTGTPFRTVTDTDGAFDLINVPAGTYQARFRKSGQQSVEQAVTVEAGRTIELADVVLTPLDPASVLGRSILGSVTILDAQGDLVADYAAVVVTLDGTSYSARPDASGVFAFADLPAEPFLVTARAEGFRLERPVRVDLAAVEIAEVSLRLRAARGPDEEFGTLIGQVALEDIGTQGLSGITVSLAGTSYLAVTDGEGIYTIERIPAGVYDLTATLTGYEPALVRGVAIPAGDPTLGPPMRLKRAVEAPRVVAVRPPSGTSDVGIDDPTIVQITFSTRMNRASLAEALSITPRVDYQIGAGEEDRLEIRLAGYSREGLPLRYGTRYTIRLSTRAQSMEGVALREPFSSHFTTGRPKIIRTWPADGQEGVFVHTTQPIRVYFNAPVDPEGLKAEDVTIRPPLALNPNVYITQDARTGWGTMAIAGVFESDVQYTVSIRGNLRTITGDRISNLPYRFQFRTGPRWEGLNRYGERDRRDRLREEERRR